MRNGGTFRRWRVILPISRKRKIQVAIITSFMDYSQLNFRCFFVKNGEEVTEQCESDDVEVAFLDDAMLVSEFL